jgi:hypothetical protein
MDEACQTIHIHAQKIEIIIGNYFDNLISNLFLGPGLLLDIFDFFNRLHPLTIFKMGGVI